MSYRVEFHASALAQFHGLPSPAFDGNFGLRSFYIDDSRSLIRIFDVTWAG